MTLAIVDPEALNRVTHEFNEADRELTAFVEENQEVLEPLRALTDRRNRALNALEAVARDSKMSLGPVVLDKKIQKVDPLKARQVLGPDGFAAIGGTIRNVPELTIDRVRQAIKDGTLTKETADSFVNETASFKKPGEYKVP